MEDSSLFGLSLDTTAKSHLNDTARWAKFLAITGFFFLLVLIAVGIYSAVTISKYEEMYEPLGGRDGINRGAYSAGMIIGYSIFAIVAFFPLLFILRFANQMKDALQNNDGVQLTSSFQNLKIYFRYLGIITIVFLVLMGISFVMGIATAALN